MKKRFTEESQIIAAIDKCHSLAETLAKEAEAMDLKADELFRVRETVEDAKLKRLMASKIRQRANNLKNKKAKKLGEKLSEFRTGLISPAINDAPSIPA